MQQSSSGVRVPQELQAAPRSVLEEYVRARLVQFAAAFTDRLTPSFSPQTLQQLFADALVALPPPVYERTPGPDTRDLQLVFRHDCLSLGCQDPLCLLCEHNPHRRCDHNFAPRFLVSDALKARCGAPIRVEVIDKRTGLPLRDDAPEDVQLQLDVLDGQQYDGLCTEEGAACDTSALEGCKLLHNKEGRPLLQAGDQPDQADAASHVLLPLTRGRAQLAALSVTESCEALLSGRKPPFRLLARGLQGDGRPAAIGHAVSEGFVVATRRTKTAAKVHIPSVEDHISKLVHMGKVTVAKLADLHAAARQAGLRLDVPNNCITTVGAFRKLVLLAESDEGLRHTLQQVLKLTKEPWAEASEHALRAVTQDSRARLWYAPSSANRLGLLFATQQGSPDLQKPLGLLQSPTAEPSSSGRPVLEVTPTVQQTPAQRQLVRQLQAQAAAAWWHPGHPGWAVHPQDWQQFSSAAGRAPVTSLQQPPLTASGSVPGTGDRAAKRSRSADASSTLTQPEAGLAPSTASPALSVCGALVMPPTVSAPISAGSMDLDIDLSPLPLDNPDDANFYAIWQDP